MPLKNSSIVALLSAIIVVFNAHTSYESSMSDSPMIFQVVNIKNKSGNLVARLYDGSENFNAKNNQFVAEKIIPLNASSPNAIFVTFDDLTIGKYAVVFFVDNNKNGTLDVNRFGRPTEQFTFSRKPENNLQTWQYSQAFDDVYLEYLGDEIRMIVKVE